MTPGLKVSKICPICNKVFTSYRCKQQNLCSKSCRYIWQGLKLSRGNYKNCPICLKAFYSTPGREKHYCSPECFNQSRRKNCPVCGIVIIKSRTTCSVKCMAQLYREVLKGENNPNWKGGFFSRENSLVSAKLRQEVLERDSFRCQSCGVEDWEEKPSILHTHHIIEFCHGGKTVLDNLIILCFVCHWEKTHGYTLSKSMQEVASRAGCGSYRRSS